MNKIGFLIGFPPYDNVSKWSDIVRYKNKGEKRLFDEATFNLFKILELCEPFWAEIEKTRLSMGMPEDGLNCSDYQKIAMSQLDSYYEDVPLSKSAVDFINNAKKTSLYKKTQEELNETFKKMKIMAPSDIGTVSSMIRNVSNEFEDKFEMDFRIGFQLQNLLGCNCVYSTLPDISVNTDRDDIEGTGDDKWFDEDWFVWKHESTSNKVEITIQRNVSINQLHNFINENSNEINRKLSELPGEVKTISDRDLEIIYLKDVEGMHFPNIADQIEKENDGGPSNGKINDGSVKTAYHTAKKKIFQFIVPSK